MPTRGMRDLGHEASTLKLRATARAAEGLKAESRELFLRAFAVERTIYLAASISRYAAELSQLRTVQEPLRKAPPASWFVRSLGEQIGCVSEAGDTELAELLWREIVTYKESVGAKQYALLTSKLQRRWSPSGALKRARRTKKG